MYKLIIWDLDGTLVDSLPSTLESLNDGIEHFLGKRLPHAEIMSHFGATEEQILAKLVGNADADACYTRALQSMVDRMQMVRLFPGVIETLDKLRDAGLTLALFTGRGRRSTEIILDRCGLRGHFAEIVTGTDVGNHKPHPEGIHKICAALGISTTHALMCGDAPFDVRAARQAGSQGVGCLWDSRATRESFLAEQALCVIEHPGELLRFLGY